MLAPSAGWFLGKREFKFAGVCAGMFPDLRCEEDAAVVVFVRASELWGRINSFGHLSFEDTVAKEQVILNTNPDFLLALKRGYFPQGIAIGTGKRGVSKGQKSCLLFFLERLPAS